MVGSPFLQLASTQLPESPPLGYPGLRSPLKADFDWRGKNSRKFLLTVWVEGLNCNCFKSINFSSCAGFRPALFFSIGTDKNNIEEISEIFKFALNCHLPRRLQRAPFQRPAKPPKRQLNNASRGESPNGVKKAIMLLPPKYLLFRILTKETLDFSEFSF
ncbi:MAG: hypothetical protein Q4D38_09085 [Planctomycetia bacterium]|nr:hypothetical protein [Planctomycetia bacterium]